MPGMLRMTRNDVATYDLLSRAGSDAKNALLQMGLAKAADVQPTSETSASLTETTPGIDGMVYDSDTGQYLPRYMDANGRPTEVASTQMGDALGGEQVDGVRPTFDAKVSTKHRMGQQEQDRPFSREQIDAERFRNQADVLTRAGMAEKASVYHGLAKGREEEGATNEIRAAGTRGMKDSKDMKEEERIFSMSKNMYEAAIKMNRPDLATGYFNQMNQNREALMARANDRADRIYRSTGNISGYVDAYNRYVADGNTIDEFKRNDDGSHVFKVNDGTGKTRDVTVPKERISEYLLALRDPKRVAELEAKRAEILFKAHADAQEALNKPVAVGKDQTLVIPGTGQTFAPGANRGFDVKEAGPVLDDARRMLLERSGNFDQASGKWNWSPETTAKAVTAERLFMKNPSLTPAQLAEIADKGTTGTAIVDVGGKQQRVPAVSYGGRTFILGGDAGQDTPQPGKPTAPVVTTSGLGTREVRGKIGGGMQKAGPKTPTPTDFPRVSAEQQQARDAERRAILMRELETSPKDGSPERKALEEEARRAGILVPA